MLVSVNTCEKYSNYNYNISFRLFPAYLRPFSMSNDRLPRLQYLFNDTVNSYLKGHPAIPESLFR